MTKLTTQDCYEINQIDDDGNYGPFVAQGDDGIIYIGDCDNLESFSTVDEALDYARSAILTGEKLEKCREAAENDYRNNDQAEYHWHEDAELQIAALEQMQ